MKVGQTVICFLLLALRDGDAEDNVHSGTKGGNITVKCSFRFSGRTMFFCRENCKGENLLIETTDNSAQNGRYSMAYVRNGALQHDHVYVRITKLKKSDSGRYTCGLERLIAPGSKEEFEIIVTEAPPTSPPDWTLQPSSSSTFLTSATTSSSAPTNESLSSTSGTSSTTKQLETPAARPASGVLLPVGLALLFMIIILSAALLTFCRKRSSSQPKEPPMESEFSRSTQADRVYEEVREDRVDVVYAKPHCTESTDEYSLASAPQNNVEDDSLDYTSVQFSSKGAASLHSASCGHADNVIYATPRVDSRSVNSTTDASPPLYSTVNSHQQ